MLYQKLILFDDLIGNDPRVSLYEHGVIRDSNTGEVCIYDFDSDEIIERIINIEDIQDILSNIDKNFYSYISEEDSNFSIDSIIPSNLSPIIKHINDYNGFFMVNYDL